MNQRLLTKVFIWGFLFLYLLVACISFCHAIQFFNIGNVQWMSITLAFAFELGLALSLAAILLSDENKKQTLPWILMVVLCLVQVIGNVYSTFKFISLSETEYYQYLAKPLLFFIEEVSPDTVQIIVSWIIGAILPIIALFMTDMVATNIKNLHKDNNSEVKEVTSVEEDKGAITPPKNEEFKKEVKKEITPPKTEDLEQEVKKEITPPKILNKIKEKILPKKESSKKKEEDLNYKAEKGYYDYPFHNKEKEEK